jgi:hypothetical protein
MRIEPDPPYLLILIGVVLVLVAAGVGLETGAIVPAFLLAFLGALPIVGGVIALEIRRRKP